MSGNEISFGVFYGGKSYLSIDEVGMSLKEISVDDDVWNEYYGDGSFEDDKGIISFMMLSYYMNMVGFGEYDIWFMLFLIGF